MTQAWIQVVLKIEIIFNSAENNYIYKGWLTQTLMIYNRAENNYILQGMADSNIDDATVQKRERVVLHSALL